MHWYVSQAFDCVDVFLFTNLVFWLLGFAADWLFASLFNWLVGQLLFVVVWVLGCFCLVVGWLVGWFIIWLFLLVGWLDGLFTCLLID